jgi:hypothetical protein
MALDDQVRKNADALATELGHDIQQAFGRFLDDVFDQVTREKDVLQAQVDQAVAAGEARVDAAVAEALASAGAEHAKALAAAKEEAAAQVQSAITHTREHVAREAAGLVARARDEAAQANAALNTDREARRIAVEESAVLRAAADKGSLAAMERLLEGFRRLDQATTLTGLIDALAEAASGEATRTAIFVVRGREIRGWRLAGFANAPADVRLLSLPLEAAAGLGASVRSRTRTELSPSLFAEVPELAFMASSEAACGAALPVTVGGETAAIIYGDDDAAGGPAGWRETLEILARHASRCLEAQTAIRAAKLAPGAKQEAVGADR